MLSPRLTRLPVVAIYWRVLAPRQSMALGLMSATTLSLIVVLAEIGLHRGLLTSAEAATDGGGMLTVIVFPTLAAVLAGSSAVGKRRAADTRDSL